MFNKILSTVSIAAVSAMVLIGGSVAVKAATYSGADVGTTNTLANPIQLYGDLRWDELSVNWASTVTQTSTGTQTAFNHVWHFNVNPVGGVGISASASVINGVPASGTGIRNLTFQWSSGDFNADPLVFTDNDGFQYGTVANSVAADSRLYGVNWYKTFIGGGAQTLTVSGIVLEGGGTYGAEISSIPLPPAAILFGTALFGIAALRRRKDKKAMKIAA